VRIKLNERYTLVSDPLNVCVIEKGESRRRGNYKGGDEVERIFCGYHGNLQNCLLSFVRRSVNNSQAETFEHLSEDIEGINRTVKEFCASIDTEFKKIIREQNPRKK